MTAQTFLARPHCELPDAWIVAALTFVGALYFGVLIVLLFDAVSLSAFLLMSFGIRSVSALRQRSGKPDGALLGRLPP